MSCVHKLSMFIYLSMRKCDTFKSIKTTKSVNNNIIDQIKFKMVPLLILQEIEAQIKRQLNLFWTYRDPPLCPILISSIFIDIKDSSIIFHTGCLAKHDSLQTTPVSSDPIRVQIRLIHQGPDTSDPVRVQIRACWRFRTIRNSNGGDYLYSIHLSISSSN